MQLKSRHSSPVLILLSKKKNICEFFGPYIDY